MAGKLRKGMSWLGLGSDDEYEDYYDEYEDDYDDSDVVVDVTTPRATVQSTPTVRSIPNRNAPSRVEASDPWDDVPEVASASASVRVLPSSSTTRSARAGGASAAPEPVRPRGIVRPVVQAASTRPHVVSPKNFNDAQQVGDWFRKRQPVIVNLQDLDRDLARRLLDFSSGVAYGLAGTVERVASHVYLLTPADVELSSDDRRRLREGGFVDD